MENLQYYFFTHKESRTINWIKLITLYPLPSMGTIIYKYKPGRQAGV